jgi:peptidoglycan hydrolase CwlO-like protein
MNLQRLECALVIFALCGACTTTSSSVPDRSSKTSETIGASREQVNLLKAEIDDTVADLDAILANANANPREAFKLFVEKLDRLRAKSSEFESSIKATNSKIEEHLRAWSDDLVAMSDSDARRVGEDRRAKLAESFDDERRAGQQATKLLDTYIARLKDIEMLLRNDLNASGIDAAKNVIDDAKAQSGDVKKKLDELASKLEHVAGELTPPTAIEASSRTKTGG